MKEATKTCMHIVLESLFPIINNGPLRTPDSWSDQGSIAVSAFEDETMLKSLLVSNRCSGNEPIDRDSDERNGLLTHGPSRQCASRCCDRICTDNDISTTNSIALDNRISPENSITNGDDISGGSSISSADSISSGESILSGADVYLYTSGIDALNASSGGGAEELAGTEQAIPAGVFQESFSELFEENAVNHWAVEIPERQVACDLRRKPGNLNVEVRVKDSYDELDTTVAGREMDKMQKIWIGRTFLSRDNIKEMLSLRRAMSRDVEELQEYDLIRNNCQGLWQRGMLRLIVCNCDSEANRLDDLVRVQNKVIHQLCKVSRWSLIMSLLLALAKRKWIPWPGPIFSLPWQSCWVYLFQEITRWIQLYEIIFHLPAVIYISCRKTFNKQSREPDTEQTSGAGSDQQESIDIRANDVSYLSSKAKFRATTLYYSTMFVLYGLHIPIGWLWRSDQSWKYLEWWDIGIGLAAQIGIWVSQRLIERQSKLRKRYCWAGIFARLEKEAAAGRLDRDNLNAKLTRFLSTA